MVRADRRIHPNRFSRAASNPPSLFDPETPSTTSSSNTTTNFRGFQTVRILPSDEDTLWVDEQTQRDLDLFDSSPEDPSIFSLFDGTRTQGGRFALRQILSRPRSDISGIQRVQSAIRHLSDPNARHGWDYRSGDRGLELLEQYLGSYISPLSPGPGHFLRALWYKTSYANYYEYLATCVRQLHRFFTGLRELLATLENQELPAVLSEYRDTFRERIESQEIGQFLRAGGPTGRFSFWKMFRFDHWFRSNYRDELRELLDICYELDALRSLGKSTEELGLEFPDVEAGASEHSRIDADGLFHPFLNDPVANDASLSNGEHFLFLTGPNMAGKTTYMKALGVAVYLAHIGMAVPARSMTLDLFDGIVSSLNVEDNLNKGYSYFYSEVRRVRHVAEALHNRLRLFVLFDELFKGTNVKDAIDGSSMVIDGFQRWKSSTFVLSSHLLELEEEISRHHGICYRHFESRVDDGKPVFSYRLRDGVSRERLGMLILENAGVRRLLESNPPRDTD